MEDKSYNCDVCKDKGWDFYENPDPNPNVYVGEYGRPCKCGALNKKLSKNLKEVSGVSKAFEDSTFGSFDNEKNEVANELYKCSYEYCKNFARIKDTKANSIALLGQSGVGKTHLTIAILNNFIAKQIGVKYFPYVEGFNGIRNDLSKLNDTLHELKRADVLIIDDLFKPGRTSSASDWEIKQMYDVINDRYSNNKPIVISSELNIDELLDLDEALGSRIVSMSRAYTVIIPKNRKLNFRLNQQERVWL